MDPLEACLLTAKNAGVPRDQAEKFVSNGYIPLPWQWEFHAAAREADNPDGPVDIGCGGARGPGKSHAVLSQAAMDDCTRVNNLKGLFLRQTGLAAKESFDDLVFKVLNGRARYQKTANVLSFENGSRILLGGFKNENDIDKYIGIEYDFIIIEELNQLTKAKYDKLRGSLRTSKPNWRPRMYTSFNPGGIGHQFVKERYVIPQRTRNEKETRFVGSTYRSNPYLNKEYIEYLEGLTGDLGKAWRDSEWDSFAGQYFNEWVYDVHVCDPFKIPEDWRRFCALDYGYAAQSAIGWYAVDPEGTMYLYREIYQSGLTASQLAEKFVSLTPTYEKIQYIVADPAFWAKKGERDDKLSGAEVFANKIKEVTGKAPNMQRGENDRIPGWTAVREWLKPFHKEEELTAQFQVFSTCTSFIDTFPSLIHDQHNPEDLDTDGPDHHADQFRYAVMSRPRPSRTQEQIAEMHFQRKMKAKRLGEQKQLLFLRNK